MKILLATDCTATGRRLCEFTGALPGLKKPTVFLTHVSLPLPEPTVPFPTVFSESDLLMREQIEKEHEARAADILHADRKHLPGNWDVKITYRKGHPVPEILNAIQAHKVDLVIMGSHGGERGKEAAFPGLGSISQKVARYATCPVLVVREGGQVPPKSVLVALDQPADEGAEIPVVSMLADTPWLKKAKITLIHVVEDRYLTESRLAASQFAGSGAYLDRLHSSLIHSGKLFLDEQAKKLAKHKMKTHMLVLEGDPAHTLATEANTGRYDLLVVGSTGRHGLARFLMGSTSLKVVKQAATSVLVVRE